ncbi:hypothetical protein PG984_011208 [Apiospora sp. TS-2023a]
MGASDRPTRPEIGCGQWYKSQSSQAPTTPTSGQKASYNGSQKPGTANDQAPTPSAGISRGGSHPLPESSLTSIGERVDALEKALNDKADQKEILERSLDQMREEVKKLDAEQSRLDAQLQSIRQEQSDLQGRCDQEEATRDRLAQEISSGFKEWDTLSAERKRLKKESKRRGK